MTLNTWTQRHLLEESCRYQDKCIELLLAPAKFFLVPMADEFFRFARHRFRKCFQHHFGPESTVELFYLRGGGWILGPLLEGDFDARREFCGPLEG
jgi:hypothetical protein